MEQQIEYNEDQLVWDVINEAIALREHATAKEREKLNFTKLDALQTINCIYGQMTGYCHSERALQLIQACTPRYFKHAALSFRESILEIINNANGITVNNFNEQRNIRNEDSHFSAIEVFINLKRKYPAQVESLISYLRGESDTLNVYIF